MFDTIGEIFGEKLALSIMSTRSSEVRHAQGTSVTSLNKVRMFHNGVTGTLELY